MRHPRPVSIDLFCGAGGMSLGFEQAGFDVLAAFDVEAMNADTHRLNFPNTQAFAADLSKHTGDSIRSIANLKGVDIDVVFGGPPCQGFSFGGRQDTSDERNLLVNDFSRLVRQLRPKYFVMENVKGLMSIRSKPVLDSLLRRFKLAGYRVVDPIRVLNAAEYGVPQRRWRAFILGYRQDAAPISYPVPRGCPDGFGNEYYPRVRDAISDLPVIEEFESLYEDDTFSEPLAKTDSPYALLMRGHISDPHDRSHRKSIAAKILTGCLRTRHSLETIRRFANTLQGNSEPISRYIRLTWDDVAPTIRAGTGAGYGRHTAPRPIHPDVPRCITAREAARLHSFPDWFEFHGTRWHAFRQIGNSVPPLLARAVASQVLAACIQTRNDRSH